MLRKIALYFIAFVTIGIYLLAANPSFMRFYTTQLNTSKSEAFRWNREKYGDLYGMSYLKDFKIPVKSLVAGAKRVESTPKENDLYIIGDSYLAQITPEAVDSSYYKSSLGYFYYPLAEADITEPIKFQNNGRKKILIFERTERFLNDEMAKEKDARRYLKFFDVQKVDSVETTPAPAPVNVAVAKQPAAVTPPPVSALTAEKSTGTWMKQNLKFHFDIQVMNQNIETLLYAYGIFAPVKETKAEFNYRLFGRANSAVVVAPDKRNVYIAETVNRYSKISSFIPISDARVDSIATTLNHIADFYKAKGFDEVVFSFIPNAVSICDSEIGGKYNDLVRRVNARMKYPYIDVYSAFMNYPDKKSLYRPSDTHWNEKGYFIWLDQVNAWLRSYEKK